MNGGGQEDTEAEGVEGTSQEWGRKKKKDGERKGEVKEER